MEGQNYYASYSTHFTPNEIVEQNGITALNSKLTQKKSVGIEGEIGVSKKISRHLNGQFGLNYGFFPHGLLLTIPTAESLAGYEISNPMTDLDAEYFGVSAGANWKLWPDRKWQFSLLSKLKIEHQIRLGYNLEQVEAVDESNIHYLVYDSSIETPPGRKISFMPEFGISLQTRLYGKLAVQMTLFKNFGTRISHLAEYQIFTKQGVIDGTYRKEFRFWGLRIGFSF